VSPFKRTRRATAERETGRGRHARTVETVMPAPRWPQVADVPPELAAREWEFPTVTLPASRPMVGRQVLAELAAADDEPLLPWEQELLDDSVEPSPEAEAERVAYVRRLERSIAAVADDDTQVLDLADMVVDQAPRPAEAEGLEAIPVPSLLFLNAGAEPLRNGEQFAPDPQPVPVRPFLHIGSALPPDLTAWELDLLHHPVGEILGDPDEMPATWLPEAAPPRPQQRDETHQLVFSVFDTPFWNTVNETVRQREMAAATLEGDTDAGIEQLLTRLSRLEAAHGAFIERVAAEEYRGRLADDIRLLPRRVPGAALTAIEAAELVTA
jgi:hypothetical protein